jgi:hypothetical protein
MATTAGADGASVGRHPTVHTRRYLQALDDTLGLRVRRLAEVPIDAQLAAERCVFLGGAALAIASPDWRSQTSSLGRAPSDHRQRRTPASRSGVCLVKISAPAPAREWS